MKRRHSDSIFFSNCTSKTVLGWTIHYNNLLKKYRRSSLFVNKNKKRISTLIRLTSLKVMGMV